MTNQEPITPKVRPRKHHREIRKVRRDLAFKVIDIGFKVLATKLHPDKGGSTEAMTRLNNIRQSLKEFTVGKWSR